MSLDIIKEYKKNLSFDICSDLHIDKWDSEKIQDYFRFKKSKNKILVVAGDVSSDLDLTIKYLNDISIFYDKILFVDGNHEHTKCFPSILSRDDIYNKIKSIKNDKIIYLPKQHYLLDDTLFIGYNCWWDFDNSNRESIEEGRKYLLKRWNNMNIVNQFIENVIFKSNEEHKLLLSNLEYYKENNKINKIIIVTHTVPLKEFAIGEDDEILTRSLLQTNSRILVDGRYKKIDKWIFGHTHTQNECRKDGIHYICHPRGTPTDFNRINYDLKTI